MSTLASISPRVKASSFTLTSTPTIIPARKARGLVRRADYVACWVTVTEHGTSMLVDVPKTRVLKMLRQVDRCFISDLFGSVVIGRPEPLKPSCAPAFYPEADPNDLDAIDLAS